jgi:hypothetical protein
MDLPAWGRRLAKNFGSAGKSNAFRPEKFPQARFLGIQPGIAFPGEFLRGRKIPLLNGGEGVQLLQSHWFLDKGHHDLGFACRVAKINRILCRTHSALIFLKASEVLIQTLDPGNAAFFQYNRSSHFGLSE